MFKCTNCGTQFDGNICPHCGAQYKTCSRCGAVISASAKFCNNCGAAEESVESSEENNIFGVTEESSGADVVEKAEPSGLDVSEKAESSDSTVSDGIESSVSEVAEDFSARDFSAETPSSGGYGNSQGYERQVAFSYSQDCEEEDVVVNSGKSLRRSRGSRASKSESGGVKVRNWLTHNKLWLIIASAFLAVAVVATAIIVPSATNIFRVGKVEKLKLGATQSEVRALLGDPDESFSTEDKWQYCDNKTYSYLKKIDKLTAKQTEASRNEDKQKAKEYENQIAALKKEMSVCGLKYITVEFKNNVVWSVYFDKAYDARLTQKSYNSVQINGDIGEEFYIDDATNNIVFTTGQGPLIYVVRYSDGSYFSAFLGNVSYNNNRIYWSDEHGSYSKAFESTHIGTLWVNGEWSGMSNRDITSFTFPDGVTSIGDRSFQGYRNLEEIVIPEGVTSIGAEAFEGCTSLRSVILPTSLKVISDSAFQNCSKLENIYLPYGITEISDELFSGCTSLKSVNIPFSVTRIGKNSFNNCVSLSKIDLPTDLQSLDSGAFGGSGLVGITIPDSVTSVGDEVFGNCKIEEATVPGVACAVVANENLKKVVVTSGAIPEFAFSGCSALDDVVIGDNVTEIGESAFENCVGLLSIVISDAVWSVGNRAFSGCDGLSSVTIGSSVGWIGEGAFAGCTKLKLITIPENVGYIDSSAFDYSGIETVMWNAVDCAVMGNESCFSGCSSFTTLVIGKDVETLNAPLFVDCASLRSVTLNAESASCLGKDSAPFSGCYSLKSVTVGADVIEISPYVFYGCNGITSLTFNAENAVCNGSESSAPFSSCSALANITIGSKVRSLAPYIFYGCKGITSITIPSSVAFIGRCAFAACTNLSEIIFESSSASWSVNGLDKDSHSVSKDLEVSDPATNANNFITDYSNCTWTLL